MITWLRRILPREHTVERDIEDELEFHLAERARELERDGVPRDLARVRAEREFGDLRAARTELTAIDRKAATRVRRAAWWQDLRLDLKFGGRTLVRAPGFTLIVLLTLGIAIGANTTIFSVFQAAVLRALPYRSPESLYLLWETSPTSPRGRSEASWPDFVDWREASAGALDLEGYDPTNVTLSAAAGGDMIAGGRVTPGFFELLGVRPALGRTFRPDDEAPGGAAVVVLSDGLWRTRFGRDPAVLDSVILIDGRGHAVIGVLPAGFHFTPIGDASLWLPLDSADPRRGFRFNHWLNVVGRAAPGIDSAGVAARLHTVTARLAREYPESNRDRGVMVESLAWASSAGVRPVLLLLFLAMSAVLAVACANVAGLLLGRALAREREVLIRAALGASRWRLVRQLLAESLLLAGLAGTVGIGFAAVGIRLAVAALPPGLADQLPALHQAGLGSPVLAYTVLVTLLTGLGLGLGPLLHLAGTGRAPGSGSRASGSRRASRLRDGLIVAEVALTLTLLAATAMLGRNLRQLLALDLGFDPGQVVTARVALSGPQYRVASAQRRFFSRLLERAGSIPGVQSAGAVSRLPLNGGGTATLRVDGDPVDPGAPSVVVRQIGGDYFRTMGIALLEGRVPGPADDSAATPVVVLSRSLAATLFPAGDPVGRRVRFAFGPQVAWQVAGVVADAQTGPLDRPAPPTIYLWYLQAPDNRMSLVVRTGSEPGSVIGMLRRAASELDPGVAVYAGNTLAAVVRDSDAVALRRLPLLLVGAVGGVSLILAVVGLYGAVALAVSQRSRELAIRLALGAAPAAIERSILRYGARLAALGIASGLGLILLLVRLLRAAVAGVGGSHPGPVLAAAAVLALITLIASYLPARRVLRLDPAAVLRAD